MGKQLPTESSLLWAQVYNQFDYFLTDANLLHEAEHNATTLKCEGKNTTLQQGLTTKLMDMKISPNSHTELRCFSNYRYPSLLFKVSLQAAIRIIYDLCMKLMNS